MLSFFLFVFALLQSPSIAEFTKDMTRHEGFFTYYHDAKTAQVHLEIDRFEQDFLYVNALTAGVGSNDIGLDRGQLGGHRVVHFKRIGAKVMLLQPNLRYRADTDNELEKRSVEEAFAQSILFGFKVEAEMDDRVLVSLESFLLRDAHGVADRLKSRQQGNYRLDNSRSALFEPRTKNFPENTEFEALLTFVGEPQGNWIYSVAPDAQAITVRQHHSFVKLPDDNYRTRKHDVRSGFMAVTYSDYATPITKSLEKRFIRRHRLEKKNPSAAKSEVVKPIVYYLDPGTPEPVRSALLEGGRWWTEAFEAVGYVDAFKVKMLPSDADPLDVRYNVIQWVHRSTRGWSYGASVYDPRTGEIIKGHVSLGSLRVRQDYLLALGMRSSFDDGNIEQDSNEMLEMALARLRQLSAHEIGHTLGIVHNFAASVSNRASVMDYPHPYVTLNGGKLDFSRAYDEGIGEWDKAAIAYGYQDFPDGIDEDKALDLILRRSYEEGLRFISDRDARDPSGANAQAHLWDNGSDAVAELNRIIELRRFALNNFDEGVLLPDNPIFEAERVFAPVYLMHRYQIEATAKLIGGYYYSYRNLGDNQKAMQAVEDAHQEKALRALLSTVKPSFLSFPDKLNALLEVQPSGYSRGREHFESQISGLFDPLAAAKTAADLSFGHLFQVRRLNRIHQSNVHLGTKPVLNEMLNIISESVMSKNEQADHKAIQFSVVDSWLDHLFAAAQSDELQAQTRFILNRHIEDLKKSWQKAGERGDDVALFVIERIDVYKKAPQDFKRPQHLDAPAGSPIGSSQGMQVMHSFCSFSEME